MISKKSLKNKSYLILFSMCIFLVSVKISWSWQTKGNTKLSFHWWEDTDDNKGYQIYLPLKVSFQEKQFTLDILSGYAYTVYNSPDDPTNSMGDILDTRVNLSYEILGRWPVDVLIGLDLNLPTGRTKLSLKELSLIMDPDLVPITSFGEGFNLNPTLNIAKEWGALMMGMGVGYLMRGEYDYASTIEDYDPGDIYNLTAEIQYEFSPSFIAYLFAQYTYYEMDKVGGQNYYREGKLFRTGGGFSLLGKLWEMHATLQAVFRGKARYNFGPLGIQKEDHNGYGNEWLAVLRLKRHLSGGSFLGGALELLYLEENDYPEDSPFYLGARQKIALTLSAGKQWKNIIGELAIKGTLMHDDENWFSPDSGITYRGFAVTLKLTSFF